MASTLVPIRDLTTASPNRGWTEIYEGGSDATPIEIPLAGMSEDEADIRAAIEAMAEPGGITLADLIKKYGP